MADTTGTTAKTFLVRPESAYGPTNNCIGIGNELRRRGHRVVFAAEASWEGRLETLGFVEDLVHLSEPPPADAPEQSAGQFWTDFIRDTAPEFRKPTIEQLTTFVQPTWQALIDGAMYCEPQLREIIARQRPDVIIEDNVNCFPALLTGGVPFVRMASCNPLEVRGPDVPPVFSGYASDDRTGWDEFRAFIAGQRDRARRKAREDEEVAELGRDSGHAEPLEHVARPVHGKEGQREIDDAFAYGVGCIETSLEQSDAHTKGREHHQQQDDRHTDSECGEAVEEPVLAASGLLEPDAHDRTAGPSGPENRPLVASSVIAAGQSL